MASLFVYGTLMDAEVFFAVTGTKPPEAEKALLRGFARYRVRQATYPGILPCPGGQVDGVVLADLPGALWHRLDEFEGPLYELRPVTVSTVGGSTAAAWAYIVPRHLGAQLSKEPWSLERFRREDKSALLRALG